MVLNKERSKTEKTSNELESVMEEYKLLLERVDALVVDIKSSKEREHSLQSELAKLRSELALSAQNRITATEDAKDAESHHKQNALSEDQKNEIQDLIAHSHTIPKDLWGYAGFETPEDSFLSTVFAIREGDLESYLNSLTPQGKKQTAKYFEGKSRKEIEVMMKKMIDPLGAIRLDRIKMISDTEAVFTIYAQETDNGEVRARGEAVLNFKKNGNEWKSEGLF